MEGSSSCVSSCWRAGGLSEPSLDCVMAVLGVRESRNGRRLRGSLRLKEGKRPIGNQILERAVTSSSVLFGKAHRNQFAGAV